MTVLCLFVVPSTCLVYFNWKSPTLPRMAAMNNPPVSRRDLATFTLEVACRWGVQPWCWARKLKKRKKRKEKLFPVTRVVSFPTCLKGTRSSMCVQTSVTAGEFPCLRGPVAGKSDRVHESCGQSVSAAKVCCNYWDIDPSVFYTCFFCTAVRRLTGAHLSCRWVKAAV